GRSKPSTAAARGSGAVRPGRVASVSPTTTRAKPSPIPTVNVSLRTRTPRIAATAGLTYVMTVARTGPISSMRAANARNAAAVHTTARIRTDATTLEDGRTDGSCTAAIGT